MQMVAAATRHLKIVRDDDGDVVKLRTTVLGVLGHFGNAGALR